MLISVNGLNKYFGDFHVLKDITFSIEEGMRYGLIGVNGAGKSTLLNIITGELSYESGEIFKTSGLSIGYLKQNNGLDVASSIIEEMNKPFSDVKRTEEKMRQLEIRVSSLSESDGEYKSVLSEYTRLQALMDSRDGYNVGVKINKCNCPSQLYVCNFCFFFVYTHILCPMHRSHYANSAVFHSNALLSAV